MYSFLLALIYVAFISLGLPDSLLGSGWPVMHAELGVKISYMGIVTMVISGCTIISSLLSDKLTRKFSTKIVTVASVFLTVIALFGFSFSSKFWILILFAVPYGLGAGAIDAALNNYVALFLGRRHYSKSVYNGLCVEQFKVERRIQNSRFYSTCNRYVAACHSARLENQRFDCGRG